MMFGIGKKINVAAITTEVSNGTALLVDVRDDDEWNYRHAKEAIHLSVGQIMGGELPTKDTTKKLYLYCASGNRAGRAAKYLESKGFQTENLGGLSSWSGSGGGVE